MNEANIIQYSKGKQRSQKIGKQMGKCLENHIIVCGCIEFIREFVTGLRLVNQQTLAPVVFITQQNLEFALFREITRFPQLYFLDLDPYDIDSLEEAFISKALCVILHSQK